MIMQRTSTGQDRNTSWLLRLLEFQLILIVLTLPVGRIGGSALGLPFSFGGNTYKLFTVFVITGLIWWWMAERPPLRWGRFTAPLLGFLFAGMLANAGTPYLYETSKWLAKYGLCLLFYILLLNVPWTARCVTGCVTAFLLGNTYLGLEVLYEIVVKKVVRAEGTLGYPTLLGAYVVLALPLVLLIVYRLRGRRVAWLGYGVAVLLFLAGAFTFSRAAYLGVAAVLLMLWLAGHRHTLPQILPLFAVGMVLWLGVGHIITSRWSELESDLAGVRPESRIRIWEETYRDILPAAGVTGVGTVDQFLERWHAERWQNSSQPPKPPFNHAHNIPLHFLVTIGLPGLIVLAWFTIVLLRAVPPWSPEGVWGESGEAAYLLAGAVGFALLGLVDMVLFTKNITAMAVLYLGLIDLVVRQTDKTTHPTLAGGSWSPFASCGVGINPQIITDRSLHSVLNQPEERIPLPDPIPQLCEGPPLRILHLYANYRYTGPAENVLALSRLLQQRGHHVAIACPAHAPRFRISSRGFTVRAGESGGESHLRRQIESLQLAYEPRLLLNRHLNLRDNIQDILQLRGLLQNETYNIIHAHQPHDRHLLMLACAISECKTAIVVSHHKSGLFHTGHWMKRGFNRHVDLLLVLSEDDRHTAVKELGLAPDRTAVLSGFVDSDRFHPGLRSQELRYQWGGDTGTLLFGVVARFQPYRRHDAIVRAWQLIHNRYPAARLVMIGRGEYQAEIERLVNDSGLSKAVIFAGYFEGDAFPPAVASLDALVYLRPGSDGTCRAVLQAMACGVVPIVAPVGVLPDIVRHAQNGLLLEADDPESIAAAVSELCGEINRIPALSAEARRMVLERFSGNSVVQRLEWAYRLAQQRKGFQSTLRIKP